jgi:hypothetical protein
MYPLDARNHHPHPRSSVGAGLASALYVPIGCPQSPSAFASDVAGRAPPPFCTQWEPANTNRALVRRGGACLRPFMYPLDARNHHPRSSVRRGGACPACPRPFMYP